jgi:hypothetical protein
VHFRALAQRQAGKLLPPLPIIHLSPVTNNPPPQANAAVDCVANCPRGKNTEADIIAFDACQTRCIQTNFLDNPEPKDGAGSNDDNKDDGDDKKDDSNDDNNDDGDDSNNKGEDATGTEGNNESKTDDNGSAPTKTGGAAALKGSLMGVVGLAAAVLAL